VPPSQARANTKAGLDRQVACTCSSPIAQPATELRMVADPIASLDVL
jgi:hypothetical protein